MLVPHMTDVPLDRKNPPATEIEALEREIAALPDVRAVRVVATASGRITEVHLIAEGSKTPKQLVRDVETLAQANFGIEIDRRIVSVVQFGNDISAPAGIPARLMALSWSTEGTRTTCRLRLEAGEETHIGEAAGPATSIGRTRLAAQATTQAIGALDSLRPVADVDEISVVDVGSHRVAVAVVVFLTEHGSESTRVGSAFSVGDDGEAVVRAILDAFNRGA